MNLYELTNEAVLLMDALNDEDADDSEASQDLAEVIERLNVKLDGCLRVLKNLEADAKNFKEEKERLAAREKTLNNRVKRLKDYVLQCMIQLEKRKLHVDVFDITVCKTKSVNIVDEEQIPERYLEIPPVKIMKSEISEDLKAGITVPGAELVENPYLRIR